MERVAVGAAAVARIIVVIHKAAVAGIVEEANGSELDALAMAAARRLVPRACDLDLAELQS
jgi:intracellular sulfur oxidation DsrE/DsrF family protein